MKPVPNEDLLPKTCCCFYVMADPRLGLGKIGITCSPGRRKREHSYNRSAEFEVYFILWTTEFYARRIETTLKRKLGGSEWFRFTPFALELPDYPVLCRNYPRYGLYDPDFPDGWRSPYPSSSTSRLRSAPSR